MIRTSMSSASAAENRPLRVLRVLTRPNLGGPTKQAIALWRAHQDEQIETFRKELNGMMRALKSLKKSRRG